MPCVLSTAGVRARAAVVVAALVLGASCGAGEGGGEGGGGAGAGGTPKDARAPRVAAAPDYVGRGACAECHEPAAARFSGSLHDLAMDVATTQTVLGAFDGRTLTADGVTSTFRRDGEAFVVETAGPDGEPGRYEVSHVFGAVPLQQYMVTFPGGRRQMLRQAWDTRPAESGGQRWFALYEGQHIGPEHALWWTRPSQTWNHMCAECHSTALVKGYDAEARRYETRFAEIDVSCEACHGPGSLHVAWGREVGDAYDPFDDEVQGLTVDLRAPEREWEIDPETGTAVVARRTTPSTQIETCAPCHSRRGQIAIEAPTGRSSLQTHRPALLSAGLYHADGQIEDEVFVHGSFLQSRMYAAGVECTDCHDPHTLQLRKQGNDLCTRCHDAAKFDAPEHHHHEAGTESAQCVSCHMRAQVYMVVDPRRDHSLRIPRPDLTLRIATPNACDDCHADKGTQWSADAVVRWYGPQRKRPRHYGDVLALGRRGGPGAAEALAQLAADRDAAGIVRATALSLLAASPGHPAVLAAVRDARDDGDPVVRLGATRALAALPPEERITVGAPLLRDEVRAVRIDAAAWLAETTDEQMPQAVRDDLRAALDELRAAEDLDADQADSRVTLGDIEVALGRVEDAERLYREALDLDDTYVPAYTNLADVLRVQKRDDEGEQVLRRALARSPDEPALHYALGLLLVRTGRHAEAETEMAVASRADSEPRAAVMHGLLVRRRGDTDAALSILRAAAERYPGDADAVGALLQIHLERGDPEGALPWAERLAALRPADQSIARMVRTLRGAR